MIYVIIFALFVSFGIYLVQNWCENRNVKKGKQLVKSKKVLIDGHNAKVKELRKKIKLLYEKKEDKKFANVFYSRKKKSVAHSPPKRAKNEKSSCHQKIDMNSFDEILKLDEKSRVCVAESGVTFEDLVRATLEHDLIPLCVPELKGITVGGAVSGGSVESMSYRYGGFHKTCLEIEFVDGKGELHVAKKDMSTDQYQMLHGTFGTLGVITSVKMMLIPCKSYLRIDYKKFKTIEGYLAMIKEVQQEKTKKYEQISTMDGIIHSDSEFVLCLGTFPLDNSYPPRRLVTEKDFFNVPYYKRSRTRKYDYFNTFDYLFRYDTDCHWSVKNLPFFENRYFRSLFKNYLLGSSNLIKTARRFPFLIPSPPDVICDVFIPFSKSAEFYEWVKETFDYYPLWIVPYVANRESTMFQSDEVWSNYGDDEEKEKEKNVLFIDFAIYGFAQKEKNVNYYRLLEEKVAEMNGYKTLISHNYYTEEEFWKYFNKDFLGRMKEMYDPRNLFRDMHSKTISI